MDILLENLKKLIEIGGTKRKIVLLIIFGISLAMSMLKPISLPFDIAWISIVLCGVPIIGLVKELDIKADVLVSIALVASLCIGEYFAAGEVAFIMQLGSFLEYFMVNKAREGIEKLVKLTPQTARIISKRGETTVKVEEVKTDDILRVLPGESIPVDGIIISGETSINQSVMTGEPIPVDKTVGDTVSSGTVNQYGTFDMRAIKVGEDSSIQRMIKLVKSADAEKAKIVGIADRWATWIVVIALVSSIITWIISGEIIRAVTILVVFCPCSLVLATPTAIMATIGNVTKHGFLVKEGNALEKLATVKKIAFDKTGTLTYGLPKVIKVKSLSENYSDDDLYFTIASVEQYSEHPIGKAIVSCYKEKSKKELITIQKFKIISGMGIWAFFEGKEIFIGTETLPPKGGRFNSG